MSDQQLHQKLEEARAIAESSLAPQNNNQAPSNVPTRRVLKKRAGTITSYADVETMFIRNFVEVNGPLYPDDVACARAAQGAVITLKRRWNAGMRDSVEGTFLTAAVMLMKSDHPNSGKGMAKLLFKMIPAFKAGGGYGVARLAVRTDALSELGIEEALSQLSLLEGVSLMMGRDIGEGKDALDAVLPLLASSTILQEVFTLLSSRFDLKMEDVAAALS